MKYIATFGLVLKSDQRSTDNVNVREQNSGTPSKSLNVYDFGMKMYTSQPITAQLFFQDEL